MEPLYLNGSSLSIDLVRQVAVDDREVRLDPKALKEMNRSRAWVLEAAAGDMPVYGVNTGYGSLARVKINGSDITELSMNLIRSHAAGVGKAAPKKVVRATMLLRANALTKGASGCNPAIVTTLLKMLNAGVVPEIPLQGSVGSSGDLAPLAHLGLVVYDDGLPAPSGHALYQGERLSGAEAMSRAGIVRIAPGPKDGLAMTNGAQLTTAITALSLAEGAELLLGAEIAAALSFEALRGTSRALHPGVHRLRPYKGAIATASNMRRILAGSTLVDSIPEKVQDAYSLRCTPQVLGAVRDGMRFAAEQVTVELNSATDNPLILMDEDEENHAYSAGLFHGEPVGLAADHLKLVMSELGAISERRIYRLTTGSLSALLPPLLVKADRPGLGLMVPQTTAAALVSENRSLCYPSSADSIPTCEDQEDLVAMSTTAARGAAEVINNSRYIVAIELLGTVQALIWRSTDTPELKPSPASSAVVELVRPALKLADEEGPAVAIEAIVNLMKDGSVNSAVLAVVPDMERPDV